jgi:hypothetical protein
MTCCAPQGALQTFYLRQGRRGLPLRIHVVEEHGDPASEDAQPSKGRSITPTHITLQGKPSRAATASKDARQAQANLAKN